jgi:hypothetical protein
MITTTFGYGSGRHLVKWGMADLLSTRWQTDSSDSNQLGVPHAEKASLMARGH